MNSRSIELYSILLEHINELALKVEETNLRKLYDAYNEIKYKRLLRSIASYIGREMINLEGLFEKRGIKTFHHSHLT